MPESRAVVAGRLLTKPTAVVTSPAEITENGYWVVLARFDGEFKAVHFANAEPITNLTPETFTPITNWHSSLSQQQYEAGVVQIQTEIAAGWVYQVNLCRILSAEVSIRPNAAALYQRIVKSHPAKYASFLDLLPGELDEEGIWFVSASPELFLKRNGNHISSAPIKGTALTEQHMLEKDYAENIMITDMVRNDLGHIAVTGSVKVEKLLDLEQIPGMVQLVSTVSAELKPEISWPEIFEATFPPASVTGAPKSAALDVISRLELAPRLGYCGGFGIVHGTEAEFAVGIRSFEYQQGELRFGTGAGITFSSDPTGEWQETELKAARLLKLASIND
jgi:para-aminobenzoate synthetase component 1